MYCKLLGKFSRKCTGLCICQALRTTSLFAVEWISIIMSRLPNLAASDGERTPRHLFKILWQEHPAAHRTNLKEVSRHLPRSRASSASSAHIDRCVYYSGAKSFVNNDRRESFLEWEPWGFRLGTRVQNLESAQQTSRKKNVRNLLGIYIYYIYIIFARCDIDCINISRIFFRRIKWKSLVNRCFKNVLLLSYLIILRFDKISGKAWEQFIYLRDYTIIFVTFLGFVCIARERMISNILSGFLLYLL